MIELQDDTLRFSFPELHEHARLDIDLQRTLRIPDDSKTYSLPPWLGSFPLRHVDDGTPSVPAEWLAHGGVMLPMYQAEALWINLSPARDPQCGVEYPFAIRIAAGKINAVTGQMWTSGLHEAPQDYVVAPRQPWLDGFCVTKGVIRQFVAMPLGQGYTAEEQITGSADHGGIQIVVYPMKPDVFARRFPERRFQAMEEMVSLNMGLPSYSRVVLSSSMGLAPGGRMKQKIHDDPFDFEDWDQANSSRCFVHIANSEMWRTFTGEKPPTQPPSAATYSKAGLPWFEYYGDGTAVEGSPILDKLQSVLQLGKKKGETPLPENESVTGENIVPLHDKRAGNQVREGTF